MTGRRVAVTSPQTRLAHARRRYRGPWRPATLDPAEMPRAIALHRAGRKRAVSALAALGVLIVGLPLSLSLSLWPGLDEVRVAGVPLSWAAIVVVPFPAMVAVAFWQLHRAEQAERAFDTDSLDNFDKTGSSDNGVGEDAS
ncbi:hypothetical protein GCM10009676_12840 [Prauserella halophila]|uniref:DUF485 domain-containing protein n=1 Tax=Prauserella halophila TaxID=185641 RepID=A0ABN1W2G5_9PSEU|nr:hypothetical protein [Prauserella halophila]MCP2236498.1 hypothetical protein [Prauserella halophila]